MVKSVQRAWRSIGAFLRQDVWDLELTSLSGLRRHLVQGVRILHLVLHGFRADECRLHASALTYYTLMALVPVLALSLALARVFGGETIAREHVQRAIGRFTAELHATEAAPQPPALVTDATTATAEVEHAATEVEHAAAEFARQIEQLVDEAFEQVGRIDFTTLGGVGLVMLLWMVIGVLGRVEASFNRVWSVGVERTLWRKFTDYLSVLLILPFLATAASSIPVASLVAERAGSAEAAVRGLMAALWLRQLLVLGLTSLAFAFMLIFLPNTRVRWLPGLGGGLVTAILFMFWLRLCAALQVGVVRYSRIYGSFATVPILLAWVFVSWQIVLLGAELAFALQNANTYRMEEGGRRASVRARLLLGLALCAECAHGMRTGTTLNAAAFARDRRIAARLLNDVLSELEQVGLLAQIAEAPGHYLMQRDPSRVTAGDVLKALLQNGNPPQSLGLHRLDKSITMLDQSLFATFDQHLGMPIGSIGAPSPTV